MPNLIRFTFAFSAEFPEEPPWTIISKSVLKSLWDKCTPYQSGTVLLAGVTSGRCPSGTSYSTSCRIRNQSKDLTQSKWILCFKLRVGRLTFVIVKMLRRMEKISFLSGTRSLLRQHQPRISPSNNDPWRILTRGYLLLLGTSIGLSMHYWSIPIKN